MVVKSTIAPKIVPSSFSQKEKWSKILHSLRSNLHSEKSTTPCNGLLTPTIFSILSFTFSTANLPKQLNPTSDILPILPLCHNQSSSTFTSSKNNISSTTTTNHISNAKQ
jgi:hypothetical protein